MLLRSLLQLEGPQMDIGNSAQAALQPFRGRGGQAYIDDGRCAGWFRIANTGSGPDNFWTTGSSGVVRLTAAPGSICAIAQQMKVSNRDTVLTLTNGDWNILVMAQVGTFTTRPDKTLAWKTRVRFAVRSAVATSPGPNLTAFSPLAGLPTYRSR